MLKHIDILKTIEKLAPGQRVVWRLSKTFGSAITVVIPDSSKTDEKDKRYTLHLGETLEKAMASRPFMHGQRVKNVSTWVGDRNPTLVEGPASSG